MEWCWGAFPTTTVFTIFKLMSITETPPPLPSSQPKPAGSFLAIVLSLGLGLFLSCAVLYVLDASLLLFLGRNDLSGASGILFLVTLFVSILIYGMTGFARGIPKRLFLPLTLFIPVSSLAVLPLLVYFHEQVYFIGWMVSLCMLALGLFILRRAQGGLKFRWPLFPAHALGGGSFSWRRLSGFLLVNVLVLLPLAVVYLAFCASLAVDHFTDGFVKLRPSGLISQVRKYSRDDGRTIQLVPMSHVGEPEFYHDLVASFPADSVILMEGVSDKDHLLATDPQKPSEGKPGYSRMANSLGVAEQQNEFRPLSEMVAADVDVSVFSRSTIDLLKQVLLVHSKGVNAKTLPFMMTPGDPGLEAKLFDDLLTKRNEHLLGVIREQLTRAEKIIVPWGAAHMPGISREILKSGFRLEETKEYVAIRFGS